MMTQARVLKIGVLIIAIVVGGRGAPAQAAVVDRIVAILNDELILLSEVREHAARPAAQAAANLRAAANSEDAALHYLIERRLVAHDVQYLAVPRDIAAAKMLAIRYIVATYHAQDAQAFATAIRTAGLADADLDDELMLYMKGVDYIRRKYRFSDDVDDVDRVFALFVGWVHDLKEQATLQLVY